MHGYCCRSAFGSLDLQKSLTKNLELNFLYNYKKGWCASEETLSKIEVRDNILIKRNNISVDYIKTYYNEHCYEYLNLNTFLIITSLLGELDTKCYDMVAKNFVKYGIFKVMPFDEIWSECSKKMNKNKESQDYELFCDLLDNNDFIEYVVDDIIEFETLRDKNVLKTLKVKLNDIACNSEILGTYDRFKREVNIKRKG